MRLFADIFLFLSRSKFFFTAMFLSCILSLLYLFQFLQCNVSSLCGNVHILQCWPWNQLCVILCFVAELFFVLTTLFSLFLSLGVWAFSIVCLIFTVIYTALTKSLFLYLLCLSCKCLFLCSLKLVILLRKLLRCAWDMKVQLQFLERFLRIFIELLGILFIANIFA